MLIFQRQYKISNFGGSIPPTTNHNPRKKNITRDGGGHNTMDANNQTLVIFFLGVALLLSLYFQYTQAVDVIIGIFGGIFMQKTLSEKQEETLREYYIQEYEENEGMVDDV
jgi:hypothetical protein